ncbi:hypothetical protein PM038_16370 [Halorubrum ezzemoulense]|uniref:homing endonuclease associated repeat-containing protein n=1 Tax=Halorubrum ezzemoulense TaxID=337243 RepID=UPI00232F608B|nr:hypothetical protein [Halorubrum ezzemoulense]MDB2286801.1 hypothetical protein [Halorubrum ezzemoulense]
MIPDEDLLNEINRLADGESPPTTREFANEAEYGLSTVFRRWESWNKALQEAEFTPNEEVNISDEKLLNVLREDAQGPVAPGVKSSTYASRTYYRRFESYWRACVQAGLQPNRRRPLTHSESQEFFEASLKQTKPQHQLIGLLAQFTGLPAKWLPEISPDWVTIRAESVIVTVPANETTSGERWTFKIPNAWNSKSKGRQDTTLPGLLTWALEQDGSVGFTAGIEQILYRIARDAELHNREQVHREQIGSVPLVRPSDLRATGGVQMARNGASARRIRRHLGIEHTNWEADVEDFFLWLDVHEGYKHSEYDPPDIVLDSVL